MTTRASDMPLSLVTPSPRSADADSDIALIDRLRGGDTRAAETLVRRYHGPLMGYLLRLGGQPAVAEELHQQTWLSVLEHAGRFKPTEGATFKSWLFRIATNKANDLWRRRKREPTGDAALEMTAAPIIEDRTQAAEEAARLRAAIANLPEAQRQVLVMRYYGGLKFTEIAEALGCPLNTALGRMHKAMIRLKAMLDEEGKPL